ncbi:hypothetical protein T484DRAFT_2493102 [Baffinella frigidus]|nr:hypothetical protein T484DRAFT_2493102 [Cryptophyta sp. CCMP2293]
MLKDAFPDKDAAALPASPEVGRAREVSGNGRQGDGMDPLLSSRSVAVMGPSGDESALNDVGSWC